MIALVAAVALAGEPAKTGPVPPEGKLGITGSTDDEGSLKAGLSWRWGEADVPEDEGASFALRENALTVTAGLATASGKASLVPTSLPNGGVLGISYGVLYKQGQSFEDLMADLARAGEANTLVVAACKKACVTPVGDDIAWCRDNLEDLEAGDLERKKWCSAGKAAVAARQVTSGGIPNHRAIFAGVEGKFQSFDWADANEAGAVTEETGGRAGWKVWANVSGASGTRPVAGTHWTYDATVKFSDSYEDNETTVQWCSPVGTYDDEGTSLAAESCEDAPFGEPALTRTLSFRGGPGLIDGGLSRWRASLGLIADFSFDDAFALTETKVGVGLPIYVHLDRLKHEGTFKGLLQVTPTLTCQVEEDCAEWTPGISLAVLTQKYLLDPTLAP